MYFSTLLIANIEKTTADEGARVEKKVPKIDLLAQQLAENRKIEFLSVSTKDRLVRFLRSIASFS